MIYIKFKGTINKIFLLRCKKVKIYYYMEIIIILKSPVFIFNNYYIITMKI